MNQNDADPPPSDIEALRALLAATRAERDAALAERDAVIAERDQALAQNDRLQHLLQQLRRTQFGRRSEKLEPDQLNLAFEDIEQAIAASEADDAKKNPVAARARAAKRRANRGALPSHLPRVHVTIEPDDIHCPCCLAPMHVIGEETSQRLDAIPLCQQLVSTGQFVLHGSPVSILLEVLHPRLADDASKASGNLRAVYASTDVLPVLLHATLNKPYLASVFQSFTIGYRRVGDRMQVRVSDNVYEMFKNGDPNVRTEGIVYVLLKAVMTQSWDALHEYHSEASVIPLASLKVPISVGESLLVFPSESKVGTLMRFSAQELQSIAEHLRSRRNVR